MVRLLAALTSRYTRMLSRPKPYQGLLIYSFAVGKGHALENDAHRSFRVVRWVTYALSIFHLLVDDRIHEIKRHAALATDLWVQQSGKKNAHMPYSQFEVKGSELNSTQLNSTQLDSTAYAYLRGLLLLRRTSNSIQRCAVHAAGDVLLSG